jgi:hypothetical protein
VTVRRFPRIVSEEEVVTLENPCTSKEVLEVLNGFIKDKSPGPDGWTNEFFLHFYELVGKDLLEAVEETRINGDAIRSINSTFLALVQKVNCPTSFGHFRPVSTRSRLQIAGKASPVPIRVRWMLVLYGWR